MRDHDGSLAFHQAVERLENQLLGAGIEFGTGLVQDQDGGVADDGAGNRDTLPLSAREGHAALSHDGVITFGHLLDELVRVRQFSRVQDFVAAGAGLAVCDVVPDGPVEQDGFLQDEADLLAQRLLRIPPDIDAIDLHGALVQIVKARNEADDGGLAGPGGTDQRGRLSRFNPKGNILENAEFSRRNRRSRDRTRYVPEMAVRFARPADRGPHGWCPGLRGCVVADGRL